MTSTALQEPKCPLLVTSNLRFSKILRLEIIHMSYNMKECGNRIRQLRIKKGFTQGSIAGMLNIDRSFYSRIEAGKNGCAIDLLVQLSELFEVSLDYLILGKYSGTLIGQIERTLVKKDIEKLMSDLNQFKESL